MWRLIYFVPLWAAFLALRTIFIFLGLLLIPIATLFEAYYFRKSPITNKSGLHWKWKFMWPWDNEEDGIYNDTYSDLGFKETIIYWTALRNPANNLRYVPILSVIINPKRVRWRGGPYESVLAYDKKPAAPEWFFAWQEDSAYGCIWVQWKMFGGIWRLWLGHAIYPSDIYGVTPYRIPSAGFKTQFKRIS